jgi:NDP-sugar pyrophosphorylase family protein
MFEYGIIMAAGEGTRMHPYTLDVPKPLMPGEGRCLLQHQIEFLRPFVKRIVVTVGYKGSMVEKVALKLGADEVLDIGNKGNAYWLNDERIRSISSPTIVITCDNLMTINLAELEFEVQSHSKVGTIVAIKNSDATDGNFILSHKGKVLSMKSQENVGSLLATGLQVIVPAGIPSQQHEIDDFGQVWDLLIETNNLVLSKNSPSSWYAVDTYGELQLALSQNII